MSETAEERLEAAQRAYDDMLRAFYEPQKHPEVEWYQVEHARRMVVAALRHVKKEK